MAAKNISVRLRLFSVARDLAGFEERVIELPADSPSTAVLAYLASQNPRFDQWKSSLRLAINMQYADASVSLRDGDEVAIIPPVSGG